MSILNPWLWGARQLWCAGRRVLAITVLASEIFAILFVGLFGFYLLSDHGWANWPFGHSTPHKGTAVVKTVEDAGGENIFLLYGTGKSGENLSEGFRLDSGAHKAQAEANKARAEAEAERARESRLQRAKELRELGAGAMKRAEEERQRNESRMDRIRRENKADYRRGDRIASADDEVNLADAENAAILQAKLRREGFRLYYKGRKMESDQSLSDLREATPEEARPNAPAPAPATKRTSSNRCPKK